MSTRVEFRKASILAPNPARFDDPIKIHIILEVLEKPLAETLDVRFLWSPICDEPADQMLDELEVGPLASIGKHELTLESDPPSIKDIPDPTAPTALLVSFFYRGKEFLHLGFHVVVQYDGELPEVFTSCDGCTRQITSCYPKLIPIEWCDEEKTASSTEEAGHRDASSSRENSPAKKIPRIELKG